MTIEEIRAQFAAAYKKDELMRPVLSICDTPFVSAYQHLIYSYKALPELIKKLKTIRPDSFDLDDDQLIRFAVRYVVDEEGTIWFAQEGETGASVPNHKQMIGLCRSAGNIYFSENYESITRITNKSGHFKPNPDTLVWTIAALRSLSATFAETVSLEMLTISGSHVQSDRAELSPSALLSLLPEEYFAPSRDDFLVIRASDDSFERFTSTPIPAKLETKKRAYDELSSGDEDICSPRTKQNTAKNRGIGLFRDGDTATSSTAPESPVRSLFG